MLASQDQTPQRAAVITTLAATIVKAGQDTPVQAVLQAVAESGRPVWQRQALLAGAEAVLAGAPLPGSAPGRGNANAAANNTAPGARGGPGGARAFPDEPGRGAATATAAGRGAGGGRGRGAGASLSLSREPNAFAALASAGGELAPRVTNLLSRMAWPGKAPVAGAAQRLPPLTADEQRLHESGKATFGSLCSACHGDDGSGREPLGPTLVGSRMALADPGIPVRILLQGKEGTVGLMPPLGTTLTDEQIAGVLTYVRREWGNEASAIRPETVKDTRAATTGRTRPWTQDELIALEGGGRGGQAGRQ